VRKTCVSNDRLNDRFGRNKHTQDMPQTASAPPEGATRERIRKVAERLFAGHGFKAVSLRLITAEADVNLAAVNYHFGSKERLIEEVIMHRIEPINAEKMQRLRAAGGGVLPVETIVRCYVEPLIEAVERSTHEDGVLSGLIARILGERDDKLQDAVAALFPDLVANFIGAFARALPGVPPQVLVTRMLFMEGAIVHSMLYTDKLDAVAGGNSPGDSLGFVVRQMLPFIVAGFNADLPTESDSE
jgi:AcrR family transcriptional regulator